MSDFRLDVTSYSQKDIQTMTLVTVTIAAESEHAARRQVVQDVLAKGLFVFSIDVLGVSA